MAVLLYQDRQTSLILVSSRRVNRYQGAPMSPDPKRNKFSNRLRDHRKIREHGKPHDESNACVWAVDDQLLVSKRVAPDVQNWLRNEGLEPRRLNDLQRTLPGLDDPDDIDIVQLTLPPDRDVFSVTSGLRAEVVPSDRDAVSPNHVLVPASWGDGCPNGPPSEWDGDVPEPPAQGSSPTITLIDSGYQWPPDWGENPLDVLLGRSQAVAVHAGLWPSGAGWTASPPEVPDGDHPWRPERLDALAGHANFAAGELAQRCFQPLIQLWNHNGSFVGDDLAHVPTEAAVLNSLLLSQQLAPTPVILIVFAFAAFESLPAAAWTAVLKQIEKRYNDNFVLVAPAGNQGSGIRRFPAALREFDPPRRDEPASERVIGVASLDATPSHDCSDFSNRGTRKDPWVTCSAIGEEVASTFLRVDLPTEEDPQGPHDFADHNSWAVWQGTSFAAPKVAAAIANELEVASNDALAAWESAKTRYNPQPDPKHEVGLMFTDLG
jgi:Subtilase family